MGDREAGGETPNKTETVLFLSVFSLYFTSEHFLESMFTVCYR